MTIATSNSETVLTSNANQKRLKIAIIGTGISGLSAAWLLNQNHDVTVYEQNDYVGGHSNTTEINIDGQTLPVDTGFIVYNPVNYPNLVALFKHLDVPTKASDMSFSASLGDGLLEYSGTNLRGLLAQPFNLFRPRFIRMVRDILRFYKQAPKLLGDQSLRDTSLRDFLQRHNYSEAFIYDHLMPMGAAIWSSSVQQMLDFPTLSFLRFFNNHGLIQLKDRPKWRTVDGGSREYVARLKASFNNRIHTGDAVIQIERSESNQTVITKKGKKEDYDHVVLACHADQSLQLLASPSAEEQNILSKIHYQNNTAVVHTDTSLLPTRKNAWASWNYLGTGMDNKNQMLCVTYLMNRLQNLPTEIPVMVTLNPCKEVDPEKIIQVCNYEHPLFNIGAIQSQPKLWGLQGKQNTWFCGAYFGSGFHEDGIQAGLAVAEKLGGVKRPWTVTNPSARVGLCEKGQPLNSLGVATV
ncbi:MAG: NAD(P)-binding protein [Gammaproteobacteria bacterium]|nr:NAD(P)-binding protein [Gammaproteobacteria bacterium]MCP4089268.1 NAD(P)-binding protein [Gammaproteobacteria bacterium]MCP4275308.1 NAD(P)-binding protein [Gammaproteobacteria bacterium]MCP4830908.1 NAD(P)-binding protein [Gammaproteobacteria bacterium]MCP4929517.1 NAD(P)-binding protein [Gammaproteobacteria bacterium]